MTSNKSGKGRSKAATTAARHARAASDNARKRSAPPETTDPTMAKHWDATMRCKLADARIKELKARAADIAALERDGQLIRAELVGEWVRRLLQQHRTALDAADSLVDLRGHDPELAASLRKILSEIIGRLRHNLAYAPAMGAPPPSIRDESGQSPEAP